MRSRVWGQITLALRVYFICWCADGIENAFMPTCLQLLQLILTRLLHYCGCLQDQHELSECMADMALQQVTFLLSPSISHPSTQTNRLGKLDFVLLANIALRNLTLTYLWGHTATCTLYVHIICYVNLFGVSTRKYWFREYVEWKLKSFCLYYNSHIVFTPAIIRAFHSLSIYLNCQK